MEGVRARLFNIEQVAQNMNRCRRLVLRWAAVKPRGKPVTGVLRLRPRSPVIVLERVVPVSMKSVGLEPQGAHLVVCDL